MDLRQLEAFISITNTRSFRASANRLNLSQPAISLRIKALEEEIGVQLFSREGKQVKLTGAGLQLAPIGERILEEARHFKSTADGKTEFRERIRFGATSSIANAWLCDLVDQALSTHTHLVLDLVIDTTRRLHQLLVEGNIDVAVMMGAVNEPGIQSIPIAEYQNEWVVGAHVDVPEGPLTIHDVASRPILTYAQDSSTYRSLEQVLRETGLWPAVISTCPSVGTMLNLLERGNHIGIVCAACLPDTRVKSLECELKLPSYRYSLSFHSDSMSRTGTVLADIARSVC